MAGIFDDEHVQYAARQLLQGHEVNLSAKRLAEFRGLLADNHFTLSKGQRFWLNPQGKDFIKRQLQQAKTPNVDDPEVDIQQLNIQLPAQVNQHVLQALLKKDAKKSLDEADRQRLVETGIQITKDDILRLRSAHGFSLYLDQGRLLDLTSLMGITAECVLPERLLSQVTKLLPSEVAFTHVISIENIGAFIEIELKPHCLFLYTPGHHTRLAQQFIRMLPASVTWVHFGDLDQAGINIGLRMAASLHRPYKPLLPRNLQEIATRYGKPVIRGAKEQDGNMRGKLPWQLDKLNPELAARLAPLIEQELWLEQEVIVMCL